MAALPILALPILALLELGNHVLLQPRPALSRRLGPWIIARTTLPGS